MWLLTILFPQWCIGCKSYGSSICANCLKKVVYVKPLICIMCQKSTPHGLTHSLCLKKNPIYQTITIFQYKGIGKNIIKRFKYGLRHKDFIDALKQLDTSWQKELDFILYHTPNIVFQPIPLHKNKIKKRGFNQAITIATFLQSIYNLPIINQLVRIKNTSTQAQIKDKKHRRQNIKGAFALRNNKHTIPKNIILIDDLYTSGATAIEAAHELKKHGCDKVYLFTIAHGIY